MRGKTWVGSHRSLTKGWPHRRHELCGGLSLGFCGMLCTGKATLICLVTEGFGRTPLAACHIYTPHIEPPPPPPKPILPCFSFADVSKPTDTPVRILPLHLWLPAL